jgi:hypothetical protein
MLVVLKSFRVILSVNAKIKHRQHTNKTKAKFSKKNKLDQAAYRGNKSNGTEKSAFKSLILKCLPMMCKYKSLIS